MNFMCYSQIIPKLSLSSGVMTDIRDNVAVGRTMALEKTINYKGWKGSGYIIIDPQTGCIVFCYMVIGLSFGWLFLLVYGENEGGGGLLYIMHWVYYYNSFHMLQIFPQSYFK